MEERDVTPGEGVQINKDTKYEYGATLDAEPAPLIDPATGKTLTIRSFIFAIPPQIKLSQFPRNKQQIFSDHAKLIRTMLWADGLVPYEGNREIAPKVVINLKKREFRIIVVAQARSSTSFMETAGSLSNMLSSTAKKK